MLFVIIIVMVSLALLFSFMGYRWESKLVRPKSKAKPLVSIIIPAYKSEDTIEATLKSVKEINYPRKEVIVINDPKDRTADICRERGIRCLTPAKRMGKANALNLGVKKAKGDFLFFVDDDTTVDKNCLNRMMPWFSDKKVGIVQPRFTVKNKTKNIMTRLASIENYLALSFLKTNMSMGGLLGFRGCGVVMRRSALKKVNGWSNTLAEDIDMSAKMVNAGYRIQYEPSTSVSTLEPTSISELKKQKVRWGKGSLYSLLSHRGLFMERKNLQIVLIYAFPYLFLFLASLSFAAYNMYLYIPFLLLIFSQSASQIALAALIVVVPIFSNFFTTISTSVLGHTVILASGEKPEASEILLAIPYIFFYLPLITVFYFIGIVSGFRDKKKKLPELQFKDW